MPKPKSYQNSESGVSRDFQPKLFKDQVKKDWSIETHCKSNVEYHTTKNWEKKWTKKGKRKKNPVISYHFCFLFLSFF